MTGDPLPGATITVVDASGKSLGQGVSADPYGKFILTSDSVTGNYLLVTYTGLVPVMIATNLLDNTDYKEIDLYPKDLDAVTVTPPKGSLLWLLLIAGAVVYGVSRKKKRKFQI